MNQIDCGDCPNITDGCRDVCAKADKALPVADRALSLYKAPFRFERGYIWDANNEMVADDRPLTLWESINGPGSWALNPWVWVVEFKRVPQ